MARKLSGLPALHSDGDKRRSPTLPFPKKPSDLSAGVGKLLFCALMDGLAENLEVESGQLEFQLPLCATSLV